MTETLYNDEYLTLTDQHLIIKYFYFPFGLSTTIPYKDIKKAGLAKEDFQLTNRIQYKSWGMGLSSVWWSMDMSRAFKWQETVDTDHLVVETKNGLTMAGCTLKSRKALDIIKEKLKS
ncbi:hypothetical protein HDV04_005689 [Boothiomyces sp. JEL0838]|nr:hypothetical protein HDV04_005689 [Boothiomyces sp. JEL0838]